MKTTKKPSKKASKQQKKPLNKVATSKRESLKLSLEDWQVLKQLALVTGSHYLGKPSWRRLITRLARHELDLDESSLLGFCPRVPRPPLSPLSPEEKAEAAPDLDYFFGSQPVEVCVNPDRPSLFDDSQPLELYDEK